MYQYIIKTPTEANSVVVLGNITKMAGDDEGKGWPREENAREYLQQHKVLELFNNLTSELIYERPGIYLLN